MQLKCQQLEVSSTSDISCTQLTGSIVVGCTINLQTLTWKGSHPSTQGSTRSVVASELSHVIRPSLAPTKGKEHSHPQFPIMPMPTTNTTISDVLPPSLGDDNELEEPLSGSPPRSDSESEPEPDSEDDNSRHTTVPHDICPFPTSNPPAHMFVLILTPGGGPLNITPQQPHIRIMLQGVNIIIIKNIVFDNAFPDTFGCSKFTADAFKQVARQHGWSGLVHCIKTDEQFLHMMSGVVCSHLSIASFQMYNFDHLHPFLQGKQWISNFHSGIKKAAEAFIVRFFGLTTLTPDQCHKKIDFMLNKLTYIYPFIYEVRCSLSDELLA